MAGGGVHIYSHLYHPITFAFAHKLTFKGRVVEGFKEASFTNRCYLWLSWNPRKADSYENIFLFLRLWHVRINVIWGGFKRPDLSSIDERSRHLSLASVLAS